MVRLFRKGSNRVRVMSRGSYRIEKFVSKNRDQFIPWRLIPIEENLRAVSQKRSELQQIFRDTNFQIRQIFQELRLLKAQVEQVRSRARNR